ncbi:CD209 antigen-like protein B isoform X2 [Paroedura picta]|uniref:CD209 antigen-like protein B isoform X2 n=1 Tax=Paroedura picta TaxID=143630 RepID=UPI0040579555
MKLQEGGPKLTKKFAFHACAFLTTALFFTGAAVMTFLYFTELENLENRYRAAKRIQAFIGCYNDSFRDANDTVKFEEAKRLTEHLTNLNLRNDELLESIDDIIDRRHDYWIPFGGNLYFLSQEDDLYSKARTDCENRGSMMIDITSAEEEEFVQAIMERHGTTWLGLRRRNNVWVWLTGKPLENTGFWASGHPRNDRDMNCAYMYKCKAKGNCWESGECPLFRRYWICKLRPDPRWV